MTGLHEINTPRRHKERSAPRLRRGSGPARSRPIAVVLGGFDVVRAVVMAGIPATTWVPADHLARRSRRLAAAPPAWADPLDEPERAVEALLAFAREHEHRPVLLPPNDAALAFASRNREALGEAFALVLPDAELVEDLLDKDRFAALSDRLGLPVPATRRLDPVTEDAPAGELRFPVIVKPLLRGQAWRADTAHAKAVLVPDAADLRSRWPQWRELGASLLAQEAIVGPESRMESHHVHVGPDGRIAGEFTGRKIRTLPTAFGESTAVEITDAPDVAAHGREVVERVGLRGPAKLDFKRAADGTLHLLEINPRLTLWLRPGAVAGVNLAAMAYADALGLPLAPAGRARPGVTWSDPKNDLASARQGGVPLASWVRWTARCDVWSDFAADDPVPFVAERLWPAVRRRLPARPR